MKIVVCVKQSADGEINPFDASAYETALGIDGAEITLLSMGPEKTAPFRKSSERRGLHFICVFVCTVQGAKARLRGHSEAGRTAQRLRICLGFRRLLCPETQTLAGLCR